MFDRLSSSPFNGETTERRTETSSMKQSLSQLNVRFGEGSTHNLLTQSDKTATMENPKLKMTKSFQLLLTNRILGGRPRIVKRHVN